MGVEKFIRQLPLVIAIILMISNCQSANDSYNGDDGSGGFGSGGSGAGDGSMGTGGGGNGGFQSAAGMSTGASDPSDGIVVQLPQQSGGQWQMVSTKLGTVTKYDIYTRLSSYYADLSKTTNLQTQMMNNRSAMSAGMMGSGMMNPTSGSLIPGMGMMGGGMMQNGMMPGGGMMQNGMMGGSMMPQMMTPNIQAAQMAQAAQMNAAQLQQRVQMLMQQLYMVQMQNQQLQMHVQAQSQTSESFDEEMGGLETTTTGEVGQTQSCQEVQAKLREIATVLGVGEESDLATIVEERINKASEEKGSQEGESWEEKYKALVDMIPTTRGETPEQALERILQNEQEEGQPALHSVKKPGSRNAKAPEGRAERDDEDDGDDKDDDSKDAEDNNEDDNDDADEASPEKRPSRVSTIVKITHRAEVAEEDTDEEDSDITGDETERDDEQEQKIVDEEEQEIKEIATHVFDPKSAPRSLTAAQKTQLIEWRKRRADLEELADCSSKKHSFSDPEEWAFLKQAFETLQRFAECPKA